MDLWFIPVLRWDRRTTRITRPAVMTRHWKSARPLMFDSRIGDGGAGEPYTSFGPV